MCTDESEKCVNTKRRNEKPLKKSKKKLEEI